MGIKKRKLFIYGIVTISAVLSLGIIGQPELGNNRLFAEQSEPYSITFNATTNKIGTEPFSVGQFYSGTGEARTGLNNAIEFQYVDFANPTNIWQTIKYGGYFTNTEPISGVTSISIEKNNTSANIGIYWSNTTTFDVSRYQVFDTSTPINVSTDFNGYQPNYIKVVALGASNSSIKSAYLEFECTNYYPTLTVNNANPTMGSVSGSGIYKVGSSVTATATPNTGYQFVGWYENSELVSSSTSYNFTMPLSDATIEGRFTYQSYNLVVTSENESKGTVIGSGEFDYTEEVTIIATPNQGYNFTGWYQSTTLKSSLSTYTFNMPSSSLTYVAKFALNSYTMTVSSEDTNKGTVTGGGTKTYTQSVSLTASPKSGYSFVGWYDGETLVSSATPYNFTMPYNNLTYVARFSTNSYQLTLASDNIEKGTVSGAGTFAYGSEVTITATPVTGNAFIGWYNGATLVSTNATHVFNMPFNALSYTAKFVTEYHVDVVSGNESMGKVSGSGDYGYTTSVTITATPLDGYYFDAWYDEDLNEVTIDNPFTFTMPGQDITYYAVFTDFEFNVIVSSNNETWGTVSGGGDYGYQTSVTIAATPLSNYYFVAWYDDSFNIVSENPTYTFTMPKYDVTFHAEFTETPSQGDTYQFGSYPQSRVTDTSLLSTLNAARGTLPTSVNSQSWTDYGYYISGSISSYMWYIDITNATDEYRGVYFTSYRPYYTTNSSSTSNSMQDDNGYTASSVYWFKYEPITWRVLDVQSSSAFLMADLVLDSQDYHYSTSNRTIGGSTVYANNYKESHIRSWLNDNFYNTAFTAAEKARIQTTTVDNSAASTGYSSNPYACANTSDKVFLLSYAEATSSTYGLSSYASRELKPSAYAQSQGVSKNTSNGNSYWWLRSPFNDYDANYARYVNIVGAVNYDYDVHRNYNVFITRYGVVPALWISL